MNNLEALANEVVTYSFPDDTGRFPVSYVSGWFQTRLGEFNGLSHEEFVIDATGNFSPELCPVESGILKALYEIEYYQKAARESLRGIIWGGDSEFKDSITMVKEGDSVVQKVSKHQISRTFAEFANTARESLDDLLFQYNNQKASPLQVAGEDGYIPND